MKPKLKTSFESIAILLQGGGALGAYQAGVYQALSEAGLEPDCVAGISIGAINAAIIAGNPPEKRIAKLRDFWEGVTQDAFHYSPPVFKAMFTRNDSEHHILNNMSAMRTILLGIPNFFTTHSVTPWLAPDGTKDAISFCDTTPLKTTLERLVDFDRINSGEIEFNIGAVNIVSGDLVRFDNKSMRITPEHVMASGALPPGLPPVKIGKDYYWDGGLISNTPLQWLLESELKKSTLIFQLDLWSAEGHFPKNIMEVLTRQKDIKFSSRTRSNTDRFRDHHKMRHDIAKFMDTLPANLKHSPEAKSLLGHYDDSFYNIVHLIYRNESYEGYVKDCEFSRMSMEDHWQAGYNDTIRTLDHPEVLQAPRNKEGIAIYDFSKEK